MSNVFFCVAYTALDSAVTQQVENVVSDYPFLQILIFWKVLTIMINLLRACKRI